MRVLRIQLRRTKGWRMPDGAVKVDRSTKWGNPWTAAAFDDPVAEFRASIGCGTVPPVGEIIHFLGGKSLACWCALCDRHRDGKPLAEPCPDCAPCHADALGEIVNPDPPPVAGNDCPGHVASAADPKVCGRCGVHVDGLRADEGAGL